MKKITCLLALFLTVFAANSFAQFEGEITYTLYEINDSGDREEEESFTAYITPQRILIQGEEAVNMAGHFKTGGLLIRLDKKDFVFLTGDTTAMKITKSGITSFMNMFGAMDDMKNESEETGDYTFKKTGETDDFGGYTAQKFIYKSNNGENNKVVIWMTRDININWGMLAEPWGNSMSFMTDKDLPFKLIKEEGYLPIRATFYEDGEISGGLSAAVKETDVAQSVVQIPPEVTVTSLSQYMFQMMRQNQ